MIPRFKILSKFDRVIVERVRDGLAGRMKHADLADSLGVKRGALRKWIYSNRALLASDAPAQKRRKA